MHLFIFLKKNLKNVQIFLHDFFSHINIFVSASKVQFQSGSSLQLSHSSTRHYSTDLTILHMRKICGKVVGHEQDSSSGRESISASNLTENLTDTSAGVRREMNSTSQLDYVLNSASVGHVPGPLWSCYLGCGDHGCERELSPSTGCSWQTTGHWSGQKPGTATTAHPTIEGRWGVVLVSHAGHEHCFLNWMSGCGILDGAFTGFMQMEKNSWEAVSPFFRRLPLTSASLQSQWCRAPAGERRAVIHGDLVKFHGFKLPFFSLARALKSFPNRCPIAYWIQMRN